MEQESTYFAARMDQAEYARVASLPSPNDLRALVAFAAEQYAERPALTWYGADGKRAFERAGCMSFIETEAAMRAVGRLLSERGVRQGTQVGIFLGNSYAFAAAFLGVTASGCTAVLLPFSCGEQAVGALMAYTDVSCLIYADECAEWLTRLPVQAGQTPVLRISETELLDAIQAGAGTFSFSAPLAADTPAAICFTAGTTDRSKGAVLTHGSLLHGAKSGCYINGTVFFQRYLSLIPLTHVFGLVRNFLTLFFNGGTLYLCESMKYLFRDLTLARPEQLVLVPALARLLYGAIRTKGIEAVGGALTSIICGGSAVPPELIRQFDEIGIMVQPGYGLTEASGMACGNMEYRTYPASIGRAFPGGEAKVENGELLIRGPHLMQGYYKYPPLPKGAWYATGDLARIDEAGRVTLLGRKSNLIITENGENVIPEELEEKLEEIPFVTAALVYAKALADGRQILEAQVYCEAAALARCGIEPAEVQARTEAAVFEKNRELPLYCQLRSVVVREQDFARNGSLKILRSQVER